MKQNISRAITPLANDLAKKASRINIKTGSLVNDLYKPVDPTMVIDSNGLYSLSVEKTEMLSSRVAKILENEVNFFKNEVVANIDNLVDNVNEDLNTHSKLDPSNLIEIISIDNNFIINNNTFITYLNNFNSNYDTDPINVSFAIPSISSLDVDTILKAESEKLNLDISNIRMSYSNEDIIELWDTYFGNLYPNSEVYNKLKGSIEIDVLMIIFMISDYCAYNLLDIVKVRLEDYTTTMSNISGYVGNIIINFNNKMENKQKNNIVVLKVNGYTNTIYVYRPTYLEYLTEGSINAIYGLLFTDDPAVSNVVSISGLKDNQDTLNEAWDRYYKLTKLDNNLKMNHILKTSFTTNARILLKGISSELLNNVGYKTDTAITSVYDEIYDEIQTYSDKQLNDIRGCSEKIVAKVIFKYTNAYMFIRAMNDYSDNNEDLTPMDCASLATIDLIVSYYLNMTYNSNI